MPACSADTVMVPPVELLVTRQAATGTVIEPMALLDAGAGPPTAEARKDQRRAGARRRACPASATLNMPATSFACWKQGLRAGTRSRADAAVSPDARVNELVVALIREVFNPYSASANSGGICTIIAAVREKLGDGAARTVNIPLH